MLRSVTYGGVGAVAAGAVAISALLTASHAPARHTVRLVVDGSARTVVTSGQTVGDVLAGVGLHADAHDLLAPSARSPIGADGTIVFKRGRLLHLTVDGTSRNVWTTAPTVAAAMADLGYSRTDLLSVSRSHRLPLGSTDIAVRRPKVVVVYHDGERTSISTTDATVGDVLSDLDLVLNRYDRTSVPLSTRITRTTTVEIHRVRHAILTRRETIPHTTRSVRDNTLLAGRSTVAVPGRDGVTLLRWAAVYVDGDLVGKTALPSQVLNKPVTAIRHVGTKPPVYSTSTNVASEQAVAKAMMAKDYGWGDDQFGCLVQMWDHESRWTVSAANPSGAYGIPQALPGSKMASAGPDWETNPVTQIRWGLGYIKDRYATPCGAWALWQQQGWY